MITDTESLTRSHNFFLKNPESESANRDSCFVHSLPVPDPDPTDLLWLFLASSYLQNSSVCTLLRWYIDTCCWRVKQNE